MNNSFAVGSNRRHCRRRVLLIAAGLLGVLVGTAGYLFKTIREVEMILPDQLPEIEEGP